MENKKLTLIEVDTWSLILLVQLGITQVEKVFYLKFTPEKIINIVPYLRENIYIFFFMLEK